MLWFSELFFSGDEIMTDRDSRETEHEIVHEKEKTIVSLGVLAHCIFFFFFPISAGPLWGIDALILDQVIVIVYIHIMTNSPFNFLQHITLCLLTKSNIIKQK